MSLFSRMFAGSDSSETPGGLAHHFTADHQQCDASWAAVEAASPDEIAAAFAAFDAAVRRHLAMEEEVLFPAFEAASGMRGGPTVVMRAEHAQMRGLLDAMAAAAAEGAREALLDQGDTLLMVTQQHNLKEERILYPMAEDHLSQAWPSLQEALARY